MRGHSTRPVLEVSGLVVRYGDVLAVDGVDLEVPRESLLALLGASGCGKTSLLRAVAGFETPVAGSITIDGETVAAVGRWLEPEARRVGMVFQEGALFPHLSVWDNVRYGVRGRPDGNQRAREALALVGLRDLGRRFPDELSGGQQQRVALARALAPSPRFILLDEPFDGLDAGLRNRVRQEVRGILRAAGMSALLVTHDQEEALSVADRVAVMARGKILQIGTPAEIYHLPSSREVAHFIGGGQLLPCRVEQGQSSSMFGRVACDGPDGPGEIFVRPEDFALLPVECPEGVPGTLVERRFFGHDVLDRVRLESGETVEVRVLSSATTALGSAVRLALRPGNYRVFPADETSGG
ncbi:MAG: ABC transporter ATP-binding protein [Thermoanaerobaculia bacterium]